MANSLPTYLDPSMTADERIAARRAATAEATAANLDDYSHLNHRTDDSLKARREALEVKRGELNDRLAEIAAEAQYIANLLDARETAKRAAEAAAAENLDGETASVMYPRYLKGQGVAAYVDGRTRVGRVRFNAEPGERVAVRYTDGHTGTQEQRWVSAANVAPIN